MTEKRLKELKKLVDNLGFEIRTFKECTKDEIVMNLYSYTVTVQTVQIGEIIFRRITIKRDGSLFDKSAEFYQQYYGWYGNMGFIYMFTKTFETPGKTSTEKEINQIIDFFKNNDGR